MAPKANLFVSGLLLLGLTVSSFARIGETMDEAVKRYGEVIRHGILTVKNSTRLRKMVLIFWCTFMREKLTA
jgi:hypothetical protein